MYGNKQIMAENIIRYAKATGISYTNLSLMLNVHKSSVSGWVNAKYYPRIDYIEHMAQIFGCNKSDLIEEHGGTMQGYDLTNEEYLIIECYRKADDIDRMAIKRILNYSNALSNFEKGKLNEYTKT